MRTSQKFIFSFLIAAIILAFAATAVLAQEEKDLDLTGPLKNVGGQAGFDTSSDEGGGNLPKIIGRVIQGFLSILGIIFMGYIIYGGFLWIIARGEEEKIVRAKAIIRGSIIGLVIVFGAYAITSFVLYRLVIDTGFGVTPGSIRLEGRSP